TSSAAAGSKCCAGPTRRRRIPCSSSSPTMRTTNTDKPACKPVRPTSSTRATTSPRSGTSSPDSERPVTDTDHNEGTMNATASIPIEKGAIPLRKAGQDKVWKVSPRCSTCGLRELCLPCGLGGQEADRVDDMVYTRRRVRRGEYLYRSGDKFGSIYAVRSGFFKTVQTLEDGREQVTGFQMAGEIKIGRAHV